MQGAKPSFDGCLTHGPWGGSEGENWVYMPKGLISKINIVHGKVIDAMTFQSNSTGMDKTGTSLFGGTGGDQLDTVRCLFFFCNRGFVGQLIGQP